MNTAIEAPQITGLHHMTALCRAAQPNLDFYTQVLGLRLVKLTVNFDDPGAYHLYYGDGAGSPGTILTFFPYGDGHKGRPGAGQVIVTSLSIRPESVDYWKQRLGDLAVVLPDGSLEFKDPDDIVLRLVPNPDHRPGVPVTDSPVPVEHQIGAMHSVTLAELSLERTERTLNKMGYRKTSEEAGVATFEVGEGGSGRTVYVKLVPDTERGRGGHGSVHHIAFRTPDDDHQQGWKGELYAEGHNVSPVMDRDYFHSIYFREPGGVLFEIATDPPGFSTDEPTAELGTQLRLPAQYEPYRERIERALEPLRLPNGVIVGGVQE